MGISLPQIALMLDKVSNTKKQDMHVRSPLHFSLCFLNYVFAGTAVSLSADGSWLLVGGPEHDSQGGA